MAKHTRKIAATMATQHPDNASVPYWKKSGDGFVSVYEEIEECLSSWRDVGVSEFMWDWEGKFTDEAVIDKLFSKYYDYFKKARLGHEQYLTFRLPNIWQEKGYSLIRALMVILTSEDFAVDLQFHSPPLFEVILPMTEKASQLIYIQKCFQALARFKNSVFNHRNGKNTDYVEIIPLVESVESQMNIDKLLSEYWGLHKKAFGFNPPIMRPFLARSDPAMASGLAATVLANKLALSHIAAFSKKHHIPMYPIIGTGSLPFRGGFSPDRLKQFIDEYRGVKTVTVQSAFRYDYPLHQVKKAIAYVDTHLQKTVADSISAGEAVELKKIISKFSHTYQTTLRGILPSLNSFFACVPKRRERRQHIGFLAYQRKMGKTPLPRAISFTAGFYSIGIPPELIGLGQTIAKLSTREFGLLTTYYHHLAADIKQAGRYVNKENLIALCKENSAWINVEKDLAEVEKRFKILLGPKTQADFLHKNLSTNVLLLKNSPDEVRRLIEETGKIRKSLG